MRLALIPLALLLVAGCSGDPASSRLKIGDEAIVRVPEPDPKRPPVPKVTLHDGRMVDEYPSPAGKVLMEIKGKSSYYIGAGSKVRIISDDRPAEMRQAEPPPLADLDGIADRRAVQVKVLDGANINDAGELPRNSLRPVR